MVTAHLRADRRMAATEETYQPCRAHCGAPDKRENADEETRRIGVRLLLSHDELQASSLWLGRRLVFHHQATAALDRFSRMGTNKEHFRSGVQLKFQKKPRRAPSDQWRRLLMAFADALAAIRTLGLPSRLRLRVERFALALLTERRTR